MDLQPNYASVAWWRKLRGYALWAKGVAEWKEKL